MGHIFKIFGLLHNIYPIKKYLRKIIVEYFFNYHINEILAHASSHFSISENRNANELRYEPAFRGLINDIFKNNDIYPSPKELAIAINVSIEAYCDQKLSHHNAIIDLAYHIANEIKVRILSDEVLKIIFHDLGKDVDKILINEKRSDIDRCFQNKKQLFENYFNSFNDTRFNYGIKIWHQGEDTEWIEWNESESITVHLDPTKVREGFYLIGFDYSIAATGENLNIATRVDGYEYFNRLEQNSTVIWAR